MQTRDALFECLAAQDGYISGELLAERLGVSRQAVSRWENGVSQT